MVKIGIIGTGFMAVQHMKAIAQVPGAAVAAICNPSGRHLDGDFSKVAGNVGDQNPVRLDMSVVKGYQKIEDFLADPEIVAVDICTPTRTHVDLCVRALAAGKHVLVEKPMARTSAEARTILAAAEAAKARGLILMPAMCIRFWPEYEWVKQAIESQTYGKVLDARFRRVAQAPGWGHGHFLAGKESGGALFDLHVHDVDFIHHCFGQPRGVYASGYSKVSGAIDHVIANFHYPGGPIVTAEGSWAMNEGFGFCMAFTVNFEKATVDFDSSRSDRPMRLHVAGETTAVKAEGKDGYVGELAYFAGCIRDGKAPTRVTAADGVVAVEICEAEERSILGSGYTTLTESIP
jgi:predicted dehydrogenase